MKNVTTSDSEDQKAPSTHEETLAAADYKKNLEAEISKEMGDPSKTTEDEHTEPDSTTDEESIDTTEVEVESKIESHEQELSSKELRYKQQLEGEKKTNKELQERLAALEAQAKPTPQQTPEDEQRLAEKQYLKEQYGVITKEDYDALEKKVHVLMEQNLAPIRQEREQKILARIFKKYPDLTPEKDPSNEKWNKVKDMVQRFNPANRLDPLADVEERVDWAYEKAFGIKSRPSEAQVRQSSYVGVGGGTSASKTKTVETEDRYSHLSPEAKSYKAQLEKGLEEEFKNAKR